MSQPKSDSAGQNDDCNAERWELRNKLMAEWEMVRQERDAAVKREPGNWMNLTSANSPYSKRMSALQQQMDNILDIPCSEVRRLNARKSGQDNVQQPVLPQVVYVPTPVLVQSPNFAAPVTSADATKPGGVVIVFGIITMIIATLLLIASAIGFLAAISGYSYGGGTSVGVAVSCIPVFFFLFGIIAGAVRAFGKGSTGTVLVAIFWVILLVGAICGGLVFFLLLGGASSF